VPANFIKEMRSRMFENQEKLMQNILAANVKQHYQIIEKHKGKI
jgi:hypothetical protein